MTDLLQRLVTPGEWPRLCPGDVPGLRRELLPYLVDPLTVRWAAAYDRAVFGTPPEGIWRPATATDDPARRVERARVLLGAEAEVLRTASLCAVDADMSRMALAFGQTPARQPFEAATLPRDRGFMVFSEPIGSMITTVSGTLCFGHTLTVPDWLDLDAEVRRPIVAASWAREAVVGGQWVDVAFYTTTVPNAWRSLPSDTVVGTDRAGHLYTAGVMADLNAEANAGTPSSALALRARRRIRLGTRLPVPSTPHSPAAWMQVLLAAFQLRMLQGTTNPIGETEHHHIPRRERRRDRHAGVVDDSGEISVLRLHSRHRARPTDPNRPGTRWGPLDHRVPVGLYRQNKCLDTRRHQAGGCRHIEDFPVGFSFRGPEGAPIRYPVDWMSARVRQPAKETRTDSTRRAPAEDP